MQTPSQEPPVPSKAQNQDLKDMDVLVTFKINIESQNFYMVVSKMNDKIQIKIKMLNPSQEPQASSKLI